jgi:NADPH:quinone reductase-like Zn-dependent oxidoreductase
MLRDGKLVHNIALTVPLDDIVAAHQVVESNSVAGKVIVSIA